MFADGLRDIIKPAWVMIIDEIKRCGEMSIPQLMEKCDTSYMGLKQQCNALLKLGYLERIRIARKVVGRPEIAYRLTGKAEALFPQFGIAETLELLRHVKQMFGENAPEKILNHYFEEKKTSLQPRLRKEKSVIAKASALAAFKEKDGCVCECVYQQDKGLRIVEFHNPLWQLFTAHPTALQMEIKMLEELLGSHLVRRTLPAKKGCSPRVEYLIPTL